MPVRIHQRIGRHTLDTCTPKFDRGSLWDRLTHVSAQAENQRVLHHIATETVLVEDQDIQYVVRVLRHLRKKIEAGIEQRKKTEASGQYHNPFLPYEEALYVADVTDSHLVILNKFPVLDHHTLLITRAFEEQQSLLTEADFTALWACMAEYDALAFYNGGREAGSSQRHKHLQMIPLPLHPDGPRLPIEPALNRAHFRGKIGVVPGFPFVHAVARVNPDWLDTPEKSGPLCNHIYQDMLLQVGMGDTSGVIVPPYNFIATREWMLLLPRSVSNYKQIYINSLGFAGALLVKDEEHLDQLCKTRPSNVLRRVSIPANKQ